MVKDKRQERGWEKVRVNRRKACWEEARQGKKEANEKTHI